MAFGTDVKSLLWHLIGGTKGGETRARIINELRDRPFNPNQLSENLDLDYKTVRHHLRVLVENDVVEKSGEEYGAIYLPTRQARDHWETIEEIIERLDG